MSVHLVPVILHHNVWVCRLTAIGILINIYLTQEHDNLFQDHVEGFESMIIICNYFHVFNLLLITCILSYTLNKSEVVLLHTQNSLFYLLFYVPNDFVYTNLLYCSLFIPNMRCL